MALTVQLYLIKTNLNILQSIILIHDTEKFKDSKLWKQTMI